MRAFAVSSSKRQPLTKEEVLSNFDGGLNLVDNDLSLSPKYAKVLQNFFRHQDGSNALRYGTRLFSEITDAESVVPEDEFDEIPLAGAELAPFSIVNCTYFQDHIICVTQLGDIFKINSSGVPSNLSSPWSGTSMEFCSFAVMNNVLTIHNGINKPLVVDLNLITPVQYIINPVSGSNTNVPIGRYATVCNHYMLIAGDPLHIDRVHVSSKDTYTTWFNDLAPNDGTFFDSSRDINIDSHLIKGIGRFRDKVVVAFDRTVALYQLGNYSGTTHVPAISDLIEQHGTISHRAMQALGNDFYMCDYIGVPSLRRAAITGEYKPERVSQLVDVNIQLDIAQLTSLAGEDYIFALQNDKDNQYWLVIPNASTRAGITETVIYVFTKIDSLSVAAWSVFRGLNFQSGCVTALGRVALTHGAKVYLYGSLDDPIYSDYIDDLAVNSTGEGNAIAFDFETPWINQGSVFRNKTIKYLSLYTKGFAQFTAQAFTDFYYKDALGNYDPYAELDFVAGDSGGYGNDDQPYGGGRISNDPRLFAFDVNFKSMKLRIKGTAREALKIIAIGYLYLTGSIRK